MAYTLIRTKDGRTEQLKTVGRQTDDGVWYPPEETPKGCSFNLPLVYQSLQDVLQRERLESWLDPSWNYEVVEFYR